MRIGRTPRPGRPYRPTTKAQYALRGVVYVAALLLVTAGLLLQSQGAFRDDFSATAELSNVGDGLPPGSDVKMRGVLIGRVTDVESEPGSGRNLITMSIKPEYAEGVPASVRARVIPTNLFGAPSVDLVPHGDDAGPLKESDIIKEDRSKETLQLQTAVAKMYDVLTAVRPAKLAVTLNAIASAVEGRGEQIGQLIESADAYLSALNPYADVFTRDVTSLATALEGLARSAPALLDTMDEVLTTTGTIVAKQDQLADLLAGGVTLSKTTSHFLAVNEELMSETLRNLRPFVTTLGRQAAHIPGSFSALAHMVDALNSTRDEEGLLTGDVVLSTNLFPPYTADDCPRYGSLAGANCRGAR